MEEEFQSDYFFTKDPSTADIKISVDFCEKDTNLITETNKKKISALAKKVTKGKTENADDEKSNDKNIESNINKKINQENIV